MRQTKKEKRLWVERLRRRCATGAHVGLAILLASLAVVLVNSLAWRLPRSIALDVRSRHRLSDKTRVMLSGLQGRVEMIAIFDPDDRLYDDVRGLLQEYQYVAQSIGGLGVDLEWVNPKRDISRTRHLASQYDLDSGNQVLFRSGENYRIINVNELVRYEYELGESGLARRMIGFLGEQAFSSAILAVVSEKTPVVYFLVGHGERDIDDFSTDRGYSTLARVISRDHFDVRRLAVAGHSEIPADCDVLVLAGPRQEISDEVLRWITDYLSKRRGRVLLLLDAHVQTGLETLLTRWQIAPADGYVSGLQIPGWGLVVHSYGDHVITRPLRNVTTAFVAPRPLIALRDPNGVSRDDAAEDQIRVSVLAGAGEEGWIEMDAVAYPPVYDEETDRRGPVAVALAAELGPVRPDAQLQSTRLVVIGDSHFVSNAAIGSGMGGNVSFFMSALNWLAEREKLMSIEPNVPFALQPGLTEQMWRKVSVIVIFGLPAIFALLGVFVGYQRKH